MNHSVDTDRGPTHPGTVLSDCLSSSGKSKTEIASLLGISRTMLYQICWGERSVSPAMAARIGKLFGGGASYWLHMQAEFDAWHADRETDIGDVPELEAA